MTVERTHVPIWCAGGVCDGSKHVILGLETIERPPEDGQELGQVRVRSNDLGAFVSLSGLDPVLRISPVMPRDAGVEPGSVVVSVGDEEGYLSGEHPLLGDGQSTPPLWISH